MSFKIIESDTFKTELKGILHYLSHTYSHKVAEEYFLYLIGQLKSLIEFPYMWPVDGNPDFKEYRVMVSKKNLVFYKIDETKQTVICEIIASSDQNYLNLK